VKAKGGAVMMVKLACKHLTRVILLIACFAGSWAGTTAVVRAATPVTWYGTFGNYYIQAVNHIAPNSTDYFNNVNYGVSNWDTVTYWPAWSLTLNTNSSAPGNVHFWQNDYRFIWPQYWNWLGSTELFIWGSGGNLVSCNPPPYFSWKSEVCGTGTSVHPVYAFIRLNTYGTDWNGIPPQTVRGKIVRHEIGHMLGLDHSFCDPWNAGVMTYILTCPFGFDVVANHEANWVIANYP
jgi:hypothetical protein